MTGTYLDPKDIVEGQKILMKIENSKHVKENELNKKILEERDNIFTIFDPSSMGLSIKIERK